MKNTKITKAIFPVAGLGTRFLPATKATPKEMLVVVDKPLIQYAVEEAYEAGIREMIFVTGRNKRAIEDHFDTAYELETELTQNGKLDLLKVVESVKPKDMECVYVRQSKALGLGHAVLCAENLIRGENFALLLADDLMVNDTPVLKQMVQVFDEMQCSIIAAEHVPLSHSSRYGMIAGQKLNATLTQVSHLVEKPQPEVSPSSLAIVGRYLLTSGVFDTIRNQTVKPKSEIQLTDGIVGLLKSEKVYAYEYSGARYDCGSKLGLLQANLALGINNSEVGSEFKSWLQYHSSIFFT